MTAKIKLNAASGGGSFSLQAPSSSSNNRVFTIPDVADGTIATTATAGKILQVVHAETSTRTTVSTGTGTWYTTSLTANITPSATSNKVLILASGSMYVSSGTNGAISIFRGGVNRGHSTSGFTVQQSPSNEEGSSWAIAYLDSPNSTSQQTFDIRVARTGGSSNFYVPANADMEPIMITLIEVAA